MLSDAEIKRNVLSELDFDTGVDATQIGVAVEDGAITLMGTVSDYNQKFAAINAVKSIAGVKALADDINIDLTDEHQRDDSEIAKNIAHLLLQHSADIPEDSIKALVHHGMVTLNGQVKTEHQRNFIKQQIAQISGVSNINNRLTLETSILPQNVKEKIEAAFMRNVSFRRHDINVQVTGNKVVLSGQVKSLRERELAELTAWRADGVTTVINEIVVNV